MPLDATLRQQLTEARENILAQLDEIEHPRFRGVPYSADNRQVYAELKEELRQINELLGVDDEDDA